MTFADIKKRVRDRVYCYLPLTGYYGRDFKRAYKFLQESRHWKADRIQDYKLERIKALLRHAANHVPYYRELFRQQGIDHRDIQTFADFSRLPVLTRETVRSRLEELKADNFHAFKPIRTQTSGTTSGMTTVYRSSYHEAFRKAVVWRFFNQFGHRFRDPWVNIVCRNFDPDSPVCEYNRLENCLLVNTYHIIRGCREEIVEAIREFQPNLIWTHPSPLGIIGEYMIEHDLEPIKAPVIATYAEKMYPHIRQVLTKAFPARYIEYFANRENSFASWGHSDDNFFEVSEYCHMEAVPGESGGDYGDLITTGLHNYAVPLIRYDPGDIVRSHGFTDPAVPYPRFELIGGRGKDILVSRDGYTVPYFLAYVDAENFDKLHKYQMEQISLDEIILRVVTKSNYNREQDEALLLEYASRSLADQFKIRLEYVDDIPLTDGGKYRSVISHLASERFGQERQ